MYQKVFLYIKLLEVFITLREFKFPDSPAYVASKGSLVPLKKFLAFHLGRKNVRVNEISPGYIKINMTQKKWG